jgi:DNA-binding NarL/FixJ family response regulator
VSRVVIADDEMLLAVTLRAALEARGMAVVGIAANGRAALELCRKTRPDAVLMDLRMPVMDGLEATRRIMAECPTRIVVFTAMDGLDTEEQALRAGAACLMAKPADPDALAGALQAAPIPRPPSG